MLQPHFESGKLLSEEGARLQEGRHVNLHFFCLGLTFTMLQVCRLIISGRLVCTLFSQGIDLTCMLQYGMTSETLSPDGDAMCESTADVHARETR
jgi:hypothetical protein